MPLSRRLLRLVCVLGWLALGDVVGRAADTASSGCVWLEAEKPQQANFEVRPSDAERRELLSGGSWLSLTLDKDQAKQLPEAGFELRYGFTSEQAGRYSIWMRIGYEHVRAPLEWRCGGGPWRALPSTQLTTNLMELAPRCELAWVAAGSVELASGKQLLEIRCTQAGPDGRLLLGLDCFAILRQGTTFVPDGVLRPGQQYARSVDQEAGLQVFRFPAFAPAAGQRVELPLDGLWQVARWDDPDMDVDTYLPITRLPDETKYPLHWRGVSTPADAFAEPSLRLGHRLLYRTRVDVPAALAGQSLVLHFGGTCWIASVLVNGRYVGGRQSVLVPWDLDISRAVRPGQVNTLVVAVKSGWYAIDARSRNRTIDDYRNIPESHFKWTRQVDAIQPSSKGEGEGTSVGIVRPVKLIVVGRCYTSDVFVRTSVAQRRIDADLTLTNPRREAATLEAVCEAVSAATGKVEYTLGPLVVELPAESTKSVTLGGTWSDAQLWWPEENAHLYTLRTTLRSAGRPLDLHEQTFGFRELTIDGRRLRLNGQPWSFWNWSDVGPAADPEDWTRRYADQNNRFHHSAFEHDRLFGSRAQALDFFDRHGVPSRLSTCVDGMFLTHDAENALVWRNFENHVTQVVRAYRNHPSVLMWSVENDLLYNTCRVAFQSKYREMEERCAKLCRAAQALDPTRIAFSDGGGDLGGLLNVNCQHHSWPLGGQFPHDAFAYPLLEGGPILPRPGEPQDLYKWDGRKPLILGEVFPYTGSAAQVAWIGGPDVFRSRGRADAAAARYVRVAVEGARWQQVSAICPSTLALPGAELSFAPRAAFIREYNACFRPGAAFRRTVAVCNDSRHSEPLELKWQLQFDSQTVASGQKTYRVPPGEHAADELQIALPSADHRRNGRLQWELAAGPQRVFADQRSICLLPTSPSPIAGLTQQTLCLLDGPAGGIRQWLDARGQKYTPAVGPPLPAAAKVLLLGPQAITDANRATLALAVRTFVAAGNTAIILEQSVPFEGRDLPLPDIVVADEGPKRRLSREDFRHSGGRRGAICFPVAPAHPVLADLEPDDFFTWSGDELIYRLSYATPSSHAIAILQAGDELALTPVMELPVGQGRYLLCQALVGQKLATEPVAERLLTNMLGWAAARGATRPGRTFVYCSTDVSLPALLDRVRLNFRAAHSASEALAGEVAVMQADRNTLAQLAEARPAILDYCRHGGWLMLVGLDHHGLAAFQRLVGFEHRLRPFRRELTTLDNRRDPLLLGLSDRELGMRSDERIGAWSHSYLVSNRVFSSVVDGEEIAAFGGASAEIARLTDGQAKEDLLPYAQTFSATGGSVTFDFKRPEEITAIRIKPTAGPYYFVKDVRFVFDNDRRAPVVYTCRRVPGLQDVPLAPRTATKLTLELVDHYPGVAAKELMGLDLVEIYRRLPTDAAGRAVMLSHPGGLVKYPIGRGGIVLNQIEYLLPDTKENSRKKATIFANLLRNMGASFRAEAW